MTHIKLSEIAATRCRPYNQKVNLNMSSKQILYGFISMLSFIYVYYYLNYALYGEQNAYLWGAYLFIMFTGFFIKVVFYGKER